MTHLTICDTVPTGVQ